MSSATRVLLVGWSGADWSMIHPLLDAGELPSLERLINAGSIGRIMSIQPGVAPMVWSSIATGVRPVRHKIAGYLRRDSDGVLPTSGADRSIAPFWNVCSTEGLKTHVVNWPTYPAEPINGVFVSHLFTRFSRHGVSSYNSLSRAVTALNDCDLNALRIDPHELSHDDLLPFVPHAAHVDQNRDPGLAILASRLADAASAHAMATAVLSGDWHVVAVCYDLIDRLGHSFMRFHPPRRDVTQRSFSLYRGVMAQAYRFCDQMLGSLLQIAGKDANVLLFSDHGIRSGADRPPGQSSGRGDTTWHTPLGILAMRGDSIQADQWIWGGSLLDICPTVYYMLGLSPDGLDGRPLTQAFEHSPSCIQGLRTVAVEKPAAISPIDEQEAKGLKRLLLDDGYLQEENFASEEAAAIADDANDFNLAQNHLQFGEVAAALELFLACQHRRPDVSRFAISAARCFAELGKLDAARDLIEQAIARGVPSWIRERLLGQLLTGEGKLTAALEHLLSSESQRPMQRGINAEIGTVYARLGKKTDARRAFEKELLVDLNDASALRGLGKLFLEDENFDQALEYLLASAALQEVSPETHYLLAKTLRALNRPGDALRAIERALRQAPGFSSAIELREELMIAAK